MAATEYANGVHVSMAIPDDIKRAEQAAASGYLYDAREFFSGLLSATDDPVYERIAENRLAAIDRRIRDARQTAYFEMSAEEDKDVFLCCLRIVYQSSDIAGVVNDIFYNSHKKNYSSSSSIQVYQKGAQHIEVELTGCGKDERCEWCRLFRKNVIYYMGKNNVLRKGRCPLGIAEE